MLVKGELGKSVDKMKKTDCIITPRVEEWLLVHGDDPVPEWVWEKIRESAMSRYSATGRFTGSSAASCKRRQLLTYLGARSDDAPNARLQNIFNDGKWRHLRWQVMILTAGIVDDIEVKVMYQKYHLKGSMDAKGTIPYDHINPSWQGLKFGFELKGAHPYKYDSLKGPTGWKPYQQQIARYFLADTSLEFFVLVVENKASQEWKEWVIPRSQLDTLILEDEQELVVLNNALSNRVLPPILSMCQVQKGDIWESCPYGGLDGSCYKSGEWPKQRIRRATEKTQERKGIA